MGSQNRVTHEKFINIKGWVDQHRGDYKTLGALDKAASEQFGLAARTIQRVRNSLDYKEYLHSQAKKKPTIKVKKFEARLISDSEPLEQALGAIKMLRVRVNAQDDTIGYLEDELNGLYDYIEAEKKTNTFILIALIINLAIGIARLIWG